MGLDVYLHKYEDKADVERREKEYRTYTEGKLWDEVVGTGVDYKGASDEKKEEWRQRSTAYAETLGLDAFGCADGERESIEIDSRHYPEHMFKVGYFRSSYNDGGLNRILENLTGLTLYDLFPEVNDETYEFQPDWGECLNRTRSALNAYDEATKDGLLRVTAQTCYVPGKMIKSGPDAIAAVQNELKARAKRDPSTDPMDWFSNGHGMFFLGDKPPKMRAVFVGVRNSIIADVSGQIDPEPVAYVVWEDDEGKEWYRNAIEIVAETCEWMINRDDRDKFWMTWSG